jgi:hypothetical protein
MSEKNNKVKPKVVKPKVVKPKVVKPTVVKPKVVKPKVVKPKVDKPTAVKQNFKILINTDGILEKDEHYHNKLSKLITTIKNQTNNTDSGIRFAWKK